LGPPPIIHIWSGVYDLLGKIGLSVIFSIGQSIGQKSGVEEGQGVPELLIPAIAAMRVAASHRFARE